MAVNKNKKVYTEINISFTQYTIQIPRQANQT